MSDQDKKLGATKKRPPDSPSRRLMSDRVTFYEKVWTGRQTGSLETSPVEGEQKEIKPDDTFEETTVHATEEGDLATGSKTVKFEKVTVRKSVKSRTPSEEKLVEDSAYQTESYGNGLSYSKSSSITSLTGRFPSEESLSRISSREQSKEDWDTNSNSSKMTTSSSEWYNEYRTQSFQQKHIGKEYFRSKSEYDNHIAIIRG